MPAPADVRPRERLAALAAVALVQLAIGFALLTGLRVGVGRPSEAVQRLVEIALPPKPPPPTRPEAAIRQARRSPSPASRAQPKPLGGAPGPKADHAPPAIAPVVAIQPSVAPSGGGSAAGPAVGSGAGGGSGGQGYGYGGGGTDLQKIGGEILPSDYPKALGNAGVGGRVSVTFTVETNGRVTNCRITRSSGVPELDALTCKLMVERFRFRPSTDRFGRPVSDEVDWDHDWIAQR